MNKRYTTVSLIAAALIMCSTARGQSTVTKYITVHPDGSTTVTEYVYIQPPVVVYPVASPAIRIGDVILGALIYNNDRHHHHNNRHDRQVPIQMPIRVPTQSRR